MKRHTIQDRLDREDEYGENSDSEEEDDKEDQDDHEDATTEADTSPQPIKSKSSSIKIFVRVRPPRKNDTKLHLTPGRYICSPGDDEELPKIAFRLPKDAEQGLINNQKENYDYRFNRVFDQSTSQEEVFDHVARDVILNAMDGYNGTIFAYGQTGSGKTFTITGGAERYADRGLIPRTLQYIFKEAKNRSGVHYEIGISYLEIYNENGYDLLDNTRDAKKLEDLPKVRLQEDENQMIHVQNLSTVMAVNEEEALNLLFVGDTNRMIAETPSNPASSRSHCLFIINIMGKKDGEDRMWRSKLHLVDLAGSERTSRTGITGNLFKEASYINLSLHYLEQVIVALHEKSLGKRSHIPYRNSMMTSILRDSLGGNCMTTMIATVAPEDELIEESISTCRFAQRVALISNIAKLNEEVDPKLVIARLKREIVRLKAELAIARGETGDSNSELPDYEKEKVKQAVDDYIADSSVDASLIFSDARKIHEAFRILKDYVLKCSPIVESAPTTAAKAVTSSETSSLSNREIMKLQTLIAHRDNEINVLIGMINKYKMKLGETTLLDSKEIKVIPQSQPSMPSQSNSFMAASTSLTKAPTMTAPKPNLAASIPHLSLDKAKLFEVFKKDYPGTNWIEDQKLQLKTKYAEAKKMGEVANELRLSIKHIKDTLGQPDDGDAATIQMKQELRSSITDKVAAYKQAYQNLKDLKIEIEHMQHLLEQARIRLSRAFEQWYENVYQTSPKASKEDCDRDINASTNTAEESANQLLMATQPVTTLSRSIPPYLLVDRPSPATSFNANSANKPHLAYISNSSPFSSTSTLFLSEGPSTPRSSQATIQPQLETSTLRTSSILSSGHTTSQAWNTPPKPPPKELPKRSLSSLDRITPSPSLPLQLGSISRSQTPQLKPLKSVLDSKGIEGDIAAFYQARDGLLKQKGVGELPKGTPGFVGRLFQQ